MTAFQNGDRIRYATTGEDGYPLVRYGWIGCNIDADAGPVEILIDGEIGHAIVELAEIEPVHIGNVTLTLEGCDLIDDPSLRQALVNLWRAEAESAGLQIASLHAIGTGVLDGTGGYTLAELSSAGDQYVLRVRRCVDHLDAIVVRAERPNRWEFRRTDG